jgi:hypothetical protein
MLAPSHVSFYHTIGATVVDEWKGADEFTILRDRVVNQQKPFATFVCGDQREKRRLARALRKCGITCNAGPDDNLVVNFALCINTTVKQLAEAAGMKGTELELGEFQGGLTLGWFVEKGCDLRFLTLNTCALVFGYPLPK